jgi:peroxiredoxin Q/BCP
MLLIFCILNLSFTMNLGDQLPEFTALNENGELVTLGGKHSIGTPLVIYFYPKDDTPGCTKEACAFRDSFADFQELGATVYGVSGDSPASHLKFKEKYRLPYQLLSDPDKKLRKLFNVPTNLLGLIPGRVTYVFDKSGRLTHVFNSQSEAQKHISEALFALKQHQVD